MKTLVGRAKHSHAGTFRTPTYKSWQAMMARCYNPKHVAYSRYGGRGVEVDARWHDFTAFLADMGERPEGKTLERRDNSLGYTKVNCEWATPKQQMRNRSVNVMLTAFGRTQCLSAWAEETGLKLTTLSRRIRCGWDAEKALSVRSNPRVRWLHAYGETKPLESWARQYHIPASTLRLRLSKGQSLEEVLHERETVCGSRVQ